MSKLYGVYCYKALCLLPLLEYKSNQWFNSLFNIRVKRKSIVVKSFILSKLLLLRDIWDRVRRDLNMNTTMVNIKCEIQLDL